MKRELTIRRRKTSKHGEMLEFSIFAEYTEDGKRVAPPDNVCGIGRFAAFRGLKIINNEVELDYIIELFKLAGSDEFKMVSS